MSALARSLNEYQTNMNHQIDPKAVGAHRPLSRRRSNPPGSPDSDEGSLFGADSLSSLSSLLTNQLQQHNHSTLMMQLNRGGHRKLDRSHSEPVVDRSAQLAQQQQQVNQQQQSNSSRYKTELCRPYEENGTCKYGDKCQFAHGFHELRSLIRHPKYKTELCRTFHTIGFCPYGPRCHFVHNAEEARNNSPPPPAIKNSNNNNQHVHRGKFTLPAVGMGGNGSTADSPSPPSSLSESPTSMSTFFSDDMFPGNPFSPMGPSSSSSGLGNASAFLFGSTDFVSPLFSSGKTNSYSSGFNNNNNNNSTNNNNNLKRSIVSTGKFIPELDSPSPVGSLASDLDSLSLGGSSSSGGASPPPSISSPMDTSRALRLPIFSRISETLNED